MAKVLHIHAYTMDNSGEFKTYLLLENKKYQEFSICIQEERELVDINYRQYSIFIIHNSIKILNRILQMEFTKPVVFVPHTNLVDKQSRKSWQRIQNRKPENLHLIVGSERAAKGYPTFNNEKLSNWIAPTYGFCYKQGNRGIVLPKYDLGYFGRVDPDKNVHNLFRIANAISEQTKTRLKLLIVGPRNNYLNLYWEEYCFPLIKRNYCDVFNWVPKKQFLNLMKSCRLILQPSTSVWESWCQTLWESIFIGNIVIGTDWDGIGEALQELKLPTMPVYKTGGGYRGDGSDLHKYSSENLYNFNGYDIDIQEGMEIVTKYLADGNISNRIDIDVVRNMTDTNKFVNVINRILSNENNFCKKVESFPIDLDHLTTV